jgi:flavin reductase (DIM6/NTAB) family NADH-FMN oxidoreductase RutF
VAREPSTLVKPFRVRDSPAALECVLHSTLRLGDSTVIFGRVVYAAIDSAVLDGAHPAAGKLAPLARLGLDEWSTLGNVRSITRIAFADWPGHYQHP